MPVSMPELCARLRSTLRRLCGLVSATAPMVEAIVLATCFARKKLR
jgi:hypothetical protein